MKSLPLYAIPIALMGFASCVWADDARLTRMQLESLLEFAEQYGFTHFDEISVEDSNRIEFEGWGKEGYRLDIEITVDNASLLEEAGSKRQYRIPEWTLSADQVRLALENAFASGLEGFEQLDVDSSGKIEIEGYDTRNREIELRFYTKELDGPQGTSH